jgi:hypothetical protein
MKRSLAEGAPQTKAEDKRPKVEQKGVGSEPRGVLYVPTDKDKVEAAALESVGLPDPDVVAQQQGGGPVRLEVYWVLEPLGGEGEAEGKWWGCEVRRVAEDELRRDAEGRAVFRLLYDAFNGFEAEERRAVFTSPAQLIDVKEGTEMDWRLEGEEQEDDEGDLPLPLGPGVVDMMQVAALQERVSQGGLCVSVDGTPLLTSTRACVSCLLFLLSDTPGAGH